MAVDEKPIDTRMGMIADEDLYTVLNFYGFDGSWVVLPFMEINKKIIAVNRRSETARKAIIYYKDLVYILKEIPWYCSNIKFVKFTLHFQNKLASSDLPIPKIFKTKDGKSWAKVKKNYFFLQKYVFGKSWSRNKKQIESAGEILGLIHKFGLKYPLDIKDKKKESSFTLAFNMLKVLFALLRKNRTSLNKENCRNISRFIKKAKAKVEKAKKTSKALGYDNIALPVHGDYNPWNLIFSQSNQVIGVVDFDNSGYDNPVHDISEALLDFCFMEYRNQTTRFSRVPEVFNQKIGTWFLNGYKRTNRKIFNKVKGLIGKTAIATLVELSALGLVRGDFDFSTCNTMIKLIDKIEKKINKIV